MSASPEPPRAAAPRVRRRSSGAGLAALAAVVLVATASSGGCGQKGPLVLPESAPGAGPASSRDDEDSERSSEPQPARDGDARNGG